MSTVNINIAGRGEEKRIFPFETPNAIDEERMNELVPGGSDHILALVNNSLVRELRSKLKAMREHTDDAVETFISEFSWAPRVRATRARLAANRVAALGFTDEQLAELALLGVGVEENEGDEDNEADE